MNSPINKELANAASEVMRNSDLGKSVLPQGMVDAAKNIRQDIADSNTHETQTDLIKTAMLQSAKQSNYNITPQSTQEFENLARGRNQ